MLELTFIALGTASPLPQRLVRTEDVSAANLSPLPAVNGTGQAFNFGGFANTFLGRSRFLFKLQRRTASRERHKFHWMAGF